MKVPFSPRAWCSVIPFGLPAVEVWQLVADLRRARIRLPQLVDELLTSGRMLTQVGDRLW